MVDVDEFVVFFAVYFCDDACQVCVSAVHKKASHGVAASEDRVTELFEGVVESALPDEGRAVLVHSCYVAVVDADDVA